MVPDRFKEPVVLGVTNATQLLFCLPLLSEFRSQHRMLAVANKYNNRLKGASNRTLATQKQLTK
jgi:hypothetical protein